MHSEFDPDAPPSTKKHRTETPSWLGDMLPTLKNPADFAVCHKYHDRTYHGMRFAARPETAWRLIESIPAPPRNSHGTIPFMRDQTMLGKQYPLSDVCDSKPLPSVITISGESGSGKTLSALLAAERVGIPFYTLAKELDFDSLEARLADCNNGSMKQIVVDHLVAQFNGPSYNWRPRVKAEDRVCLVIDDIGPYQRCAHVLCNDETNMLLAGLREYFVAPMMLFLVGSGVESAFTYVNVHSAPPTCVHVAAGDFYYLRRQYSDLSCLWRAIEEHVGPEEINGGIFAQLRRLSGSPRMGSLLALVDTEDVDKFMSTAGCPGEKKSFLRSHATRIVANALNLYQASLPTAVDQMTATTLFGAAFAVACSNEIHRASRSDSPSKEDPTIKMLRTTYGLLFSKEKVFNRDRLQRRYLMTAATVEIGLSGFGMSPPRRSGWRSFAHMMLDLFFLHAHSAACAGGLKIKLSPSVSIKGLDDPLVPIKDFLRAHAYTANSVIRVELKKQVPTYGGGAKMLEEHAELACDGGCKKPCVVMALVGDKAPLTDILVGVLTVEGSEAKKRFRTTHLMLVQLIDCSAALQDWGDPCLQDGGLVERFVVTYESSTSYAEAPSNAKKVPTSAAVERSNNALKITRENCAHAFYPTEWENESFVPEPYWTFGVARLSLL
ncbi:Hypothetical protein, putative [Bodo saltans]|uniref:Uncharacterized protein n=1 Tax=Bodo saltans TaxID=75058 RepID=A0A0S4IY91_BODSA|nr:Hypothetical protein, putative [Bodo saltans]|eukprot:CUG48148.1 Hypothetical protein, putative [Bodo saltans]